MLEMKNVTKTFGKFKALDDLTLTVPKGSVYGLVGPNGAGKSTAIRLMTGIYRPDSGSVTIGDHTIERMTEKDLSEYRRDHLGFVFQSYNLIPNLTVEETKPLTKYGRMRKKYLQENRPVLYNNLLLSGQLQNHLLETEETANRRLEEMIRNMAQESGVTEDLKAADQMKWVGLMKWRERLL